MESGQLVPTTGSFDLFLRAYTVSTRICEVLLGRPCVYSDYLVPGGHNIIYDFGRGRIALCNTVNNLIYMVVIVVI